MIGSGDGVRAVIDTATGADGPSRSPTTRRATEVRDELPDHRFADAWLSADGVDGADRRRPRRALDADAAARAGRDEGAAASLSARDDGLELAVRSELDPERARPRRASSPPSRRFEPELPERLRRRLARLPRLRRPGRPRRRCSSRRAPRRPGSRPASRTSSRACSERGRGRPRAELPARSATRPRRGRAAPAPAASGSSEAAPPSLPVPAASSPPASTRTRPARPSPRSRARSPRRSTRAAVQAPVVRRAADRGRRGAAACSVSPTVELTYAVFDGLAAIATDPAGSRRSPAARAGSTRPSSTTSATEGFGDELSLLAYLDLGGLVALGEQLGLAEDPVYATFAADFRSLDALGLAVSDRRRPAVDRRAPAAAASPTGGRRPPTAPAPAD